MDVAVTIFRIGVGIGAVLVGLGIVMIALSLRPLARDARALANDARRLANLAERELSSIMDGARQLTAGTEEMTTELADRLDRLHREAQALEERITAEPTVTITGVVGSPVSPSARPPVQSPDTREDERIA